MEKSRGPSNTHLAGALPTEGLSPKDLPSPKISDDVLKDFSVALRELGRKTTESPGCKWMIGRVTKGDYKGQLTLRKKGFATFWASLTGKVDFKHLSEHKQNDGLKEVLDSYVSQKKQIGQNERTGELNVVGRLLRGRFGQIGRRHISDGAKARAHETYTNILDQALSGDLQGISQTDLQQITQACYYDFCEGLGKQSKAIKKRSTLPSADTTPYDINGLKHLRVLYQLIKNQNWTGESPKQAIGAFQRLRKNLTTFDNGWGSISLHQRFGQEVMQLNFVSKEKDVDPGHLVAKWRVNCDAAEAICSPDFQPQVEELKQKIDAFERDNTRVEQKDEPAILRAQKRRPTGRTKNVARVNMKLEVAKLNPATLKSLRHYQSAKQRLTTSLTEYQQHLLTTSAEDLKALLKQISTSIEVCSKFPLPPFQELVGELKEIEVLASQMIEAKENYESVKGILTSMKENLQVYDTEERALIVEEMDATSRDYLAQWQHVAGAESSEFTELYDEIDQMVMLARMVESIEGDLFLKGKDHRISEEELAELESRVGILQEMDLPEKIDSDTTSSEWVESIENAIFSYRQRNKT